MKNPQSRFLRHLLLQRSEWMEERIVAAAARRGYSQVTPAMNRLFAHLGSQPVGLSELARLLAVSRQAVHQIANEAARLGLVEFVASTEDGRVKMLRFSPQGWEMSKAAAEDFRLMEAELASQLGQHDLDELKRILAKPWDDAERRAGSVMLASSDA